MGKNKRGTSLALNMLLAVVSVALSALCAFMATLVVLAITDVVLTGKVTASQGARFSTMFTRVNWTLATVVFAAVFLLSMVLILRKKRRGGVHTSLSIKPKESLPSTPSVAPSPDEHIGSFKIRRIGNRYGDLLIGFASVRFNVPGCKHEFRIEQRRNTSGLDLLSVVPVSPGNSTAQLIGKYDSINSDQTFFNSFMADDEVIRDLLSNHNGRQKTVITLKAEEFLIECEEEDIFENGTGIGHEDTLLNILRARALVYSDRFRTLGLGK